MKVNGIRLKCGMLELEPGTITCGSDRVTCPECGPHGGKGVVCLLLTWVPCTTCIPVFENGLCGCGYPHDVPQVKGKESNEACHRCAARSGVCALCGEKRDRSPCASCYDGRTFVTTEDADSWTPERGIEV